MVSQSLSALILAAGQGTRMRSTLPKVLHKIGGLSLIGHVLHHCNDAHISNKAVIVGHEAEKIKQNALSIDPKVTFYTQKEQKGTGHAVMQATPFLEQSQGDIIILYADTPFINQDIITQMKNIRSKGFDMVFLGFHKDDPGSYGRMVTGSDGELLEIVEAKDATEEQLKITLCNSGVVMINASLLSGLLTQIDNNNAKNEYYLTDIVRIGKKMNLKAAIGICDIEESLGVNSQAELSHAELIFQTQKRIEMMNSGITLQHAGSTYFSYDTSIESGTIIEPHVYFGPNVTIGSACHIKAFSYLEGCTIHDEVSIGPFARLREGSILQNHTKIGNFVETKKAIIETGSKINHLSYIGDSHLGKNVNIGAGVITCNYDGVNKHKTIIEDNAFIGSNSALVAPVTIGKNAYIGSGSVLTKDVQENSLSLSRSEQKHYPEWVSKKRKNNKG